MLQVTGLAKSYDGREIIASSSLSPMVNLLVKLLASLAEGAKTLDLGAGRGRFSTQFAAQGFTVTAVDREPAPADLPSGVNWIQRDIQDWIGEGIPSQAYDAALLRNIVQFFDRAYVLESLLPAVAGSLKPGGVVAIETFTAPPEPPFMKDHASHWSLDELRSVFPGWDEIHAETVDKRGPDLSGNDRLFHKAILVARKLL